MATNKKTTNSNTVTDAFGDKYRLNNTTLTDVSYAKSYGSGHKQFVLRSELATAIKEAKRSREATEEEVGVAEITLRHESTGSNFPVYVYSYADGRLSIGCKDFDAKDAKAIRKWARASVTTKKASKRLKKAA